MNFEGLSKFLNPMPIDVTFFKDIHNYISKGTCCFKGNALRLFKVECENYMIFEGLLFQIKTSKTQITPTKSSFMHSRELHTTHYLSIS